MLLIKGGLVVNSVILLGYGRIVLILLLSSFEVVSNRFLLSKDDNVIS